MLLAPSLQLRAVLLVLVSLLKLCVVLCAVLVLGQVPELCSDLALLLRQQGLLLGYHLQLMLTHQGLPLTLLVEQVVEGGQRGGLCGAVASRL